MVFVLLVLHLVLGLVSNEHEVLLQEFEGNWFGELNHS